MHEDSISFEKLENGDQIKIVSDKKTTQCIYLHKEKEILLANINKDDKITRIYPITTYDSRFLEPKYKNITEFLFEGYDVCIEEKGISETSDINIISGLPQAFIEQLRYGLGLKKDYRFIVNILEEYLTECNIIIFSKKRKTSFEGKEFIISNKDLDKLRKGINNIHENYLDEAKESKNIFVYSELLHNNYPDKFLELKKIAQKEVIYRFLKDTDFSKSKTSQKDKQVLLEYKNTAELSYLQVSCKDFEAIISENHKEETYQKFFEDNSFLLTMFAGSPYIKFQNQAYVGGKSFDNSGGKYPDFLLKHKAINNTFIVEIKKPNSTLLESKTYRDGVFSPSYELSGVVSQVLNQKYSLETGIAALIKDAEDRDVEAYNVQGLIIIGKIDSLTEKAQKRSFELFRNNQKNIRIITYDECLEQLKSIIEHLSEKQKI
jgi:hypothetical protein